MAGFDFTAAIRVRFHDTDAQGIAHNSNYLVWFEVARVEYLERYAGGYQTLRDQGYESLVLESYVRFLQPARFDDRLLVHTYVAEMRGARWRFDYRITRGEETIAEGWTMHATVDAETFRPTRNPAWLVESILSVQSGAPPSSRSSPS